jgi:serine phosphatase RsbU (regulator of sigma subunit)
VLLIEDDEGDAFLVQELLAETEEPVDVVVATTLATALAELARAAFDCILLDLGLPDALGLDALQAVITANAHTAVIVLTGRNDETSGTTAVAAGAQDYLVKGHVDGQLLTRSIRYAIERKRATEQLQRLYASELLAAENDRLERGLLPQPVVSDPQIAVLTRYRSGREGVLGGDFYDVIELDSGDLYVMIGDVCGHGSDAAALGVALRIAWRTLVLAGVPAESILPILDEVVCRERQFNEIFATLCSLVISADRRTLRMFLAGHPAPLLITEDVVQLPTDLVGPALGVIPGVTWGSQLVRLASSWRLMLFTDGLVEGRIGEGAERLGTERLVDLAVARGISRPAAELVDHLIATAEQLHGEVLTDDVAVVVVEHGR